MIEYDALVIDGFMPFIGKNEIALKDQGVVFIVGDNQVSKMADSNGAGKTSIFDAFSWVHYDKNLRGTVGERWVCHSASRAVVESFFHINNTAYCAVREQAGRTRRWDLFELHGEERILIGKGEQIEKLFGLSFRAFQNTLLFGVSERKFASQSDVPRKQLFDELLDLTLFAEKRRMVEEELKERLKYQQDASTSLREIEASLESLTLERTSLETKVQNLSATHLQQTHDDLAEQRTLYAELNDLVQAYLAAYAERAAVEESIDASNMFVALRTRVSKRLNDIQRQLDLLDLDQDRALAGPECPMCHRPTRGAEREITRYFDRAKESIMVEYLEQRAHERVLTHVLDQWPALDPADDHEHLRLRCVKLLDYIKSRPWQVEMQEERYLRQHLDELEERIEQLSSKKKNLQVELETLASQVVLREFWVEGFGHRGLKAMLLRQYDDFIASKLASYSQTLTAGELNIIFRTFRELKSGAIRDEIFFEVENQFGAKNYDDLSSGEKQRVDLCVVLALQDVVRDLHHGRFSLALYDEIFEHFDETGCEQVMTFLTQQRRDIGSVFVISQNPKLLSYPSDHVIRVVKTKKGSYIDA